MFEGKDAMKNVIFLIHRKIFLMMLVAITLIIAGNSYSQQMPAHKHDPNHGQMAGGDERSLEEQIESLKAKVTELETAMEQMHKTMPAQMRKMIGSRMGMMQKGQTMQQGQGMSGMMDDMDEMSMGGGGGMGMNMDMGEDEMMGMGMGGGGGGGMGTDMTEMMGMRGKQMGQMSMGSMRMTSALPGFPGASHIYHIGATGFFLDHSKDIHLITEQQTELNRIKENTLLDQAAKQREIDAAEQELWTLTASDEPDAKKIKSEIEQIEKLRGDKRFSFIEAVGKAAKVLTPEQIDILVGRASSADQKTTEPNASQSNQP